MADANTPQAVETRTVVLTRSPVELYKVLKFENLSASGGEAKYLIADGFVRVNGSVERRKRKKLYPGDVVEMDGIRLVLTCEAP